LLANRVLPLALAAEQGDGSNLFFKVYIPISLSGKPAEAFWY